MKTNILAGFFLAATFFWLRFEHVHCRDAKSNCRSFQKEFALTFTNFTYVIDHKMVGSVQQVNDFPTADQRSKLRTF